MSRGKLAMAGQKAGIYITSKSKTAIGKKKKTLMLGCGIRVF